MAIKSLTHYFDYKSPYAYLAQDETFLLEKEYNIRVDFLPLTLDIPQYLGSAEVDKDGTVKNEERNPHQWRRVKYSYMDCRREAARRGLIIRGPRHIFDSSLSHIGMLFAKKNGDFRAYHNAVYERFWRRELDIEDPEVLAQVLQEVGLDGPDFLTYIESEGREEHDAVQREAMRNGVFGVPSYLIGGELFWGAERLVRVRERLSGKASN